MNNKKLSQKIQMEKLTAEVCTYLFLDICKKYKIYLVGIEMYKENKKLAEVHKGFPFDAKQSVFSTKIKIKSSDKAEDGWPAIWSVCSDYEKILKECNQDYEVHNSCGNTFQHELPWISDKLELKPIKGIYEYKKNYWEKIA